MSNLTECQIVGVDFPFFDNLTKVKYRPCVALYGEGAPPLFLSAFVGTPRHAYVRLWEIILGAPQDLCPKTAPDQLVDVSKLCTMPSHYNIPGARDNGKETWDYFKLPENNRLILAA